MIQNLSHLEITSMSVFESLPISSYCTQAEVRQTRRVFSIVCKLQELSIFQRRHSLFCLVNTSGLLPESLRPFSFAQASLFARMRVKNGCVLRRSPNWKHAFPVAVRETQACEPYMKPFCQFTDCIFVLGLKQTQEIKYVSLSFIKT